MRWLRLPSASAPSIVIQVVERLRDIVAQRVDRGADIENQAGLALERDALGEVAGDRGLRRCRRPSPGIRRPSWPTRLGARPRLACPARPFASASRFAFSAAFTLKASTALAMLPTSSLRLRPGSSTPKFALGQLVHALGQEPVIGLDTDRAIRNAMRPPTSNTSPPTIF